jgi:hypothetical protein
MFTEIPRGQESVSTAASATEHLGTLPSFIRLILSFFHVTSSAWLSCGGQINLDNFFDEFLNYLVMYIFLVQYNRSYRFNR